MIGPAPLGLPASQRACPAALYINEVSAPLLHAQPQVFEVWHETGEPGCSRRPSVTKPTQLPHWEVTTLIIWPVKKFASGSERMDARSPPYAPPAVLHRLRLAAKVLPVAGL